MLFLPISIKADDGFEVSDEGAWCWFADPRATHYENASGTINATYIGYIDVHGNVKATQFDWLTGTKTDVLIRSYFQPDDHNNPTFIVLPDERVMIFYTRHTDEPCIWYRISRKPGDITDLGEEKRLATANNTTYPSPFILSDDPDHVYLCWRGINWHPTIARITMPDADDNCRFDFGPKQIVQSTGARPYCKYQSNGKDKIYLCYTTGHPDNEYPNWLYFNVVDINKGNGPILRDIKGKQLSVIANGTFAVSKTDSYYNSYPMTVVDKTANNRNWVWQITLDSDENPVIAYTHIDNNKTAHSYWYGHWNGSAWKSSKLSDGGHAFHQNWNSTERCYSAGMAVDSDNPSEFYMGIPTTNGAFNTNGTFEIWKYTLDTDGKVTSKTQITTNSAKNNMRPFIIPGSKNSPMRLIWMNGDYYYWLVRTGYPKGYPTGIRCDYTWPEQPQTLPDTDIDCICLSKGLTYAMGIAMDANNYKGDLIKDTNFSYSIRESDQRPVITINGTEYVGQNRLLTSDDWALYSNGTNGDNHPTKLSTWVLTLTYDGERLIAYRNGLVDQVVEVKDLNVNITNSGKPEYGDAFYQTVLLEGNYGKVATPMEVQALTAQMMQEINKDIYKAAIQAINLPAEIHTDMVLPQTSLGQDVTWTSSNKNILAPDGTVVLPTAATAVELTATIGSETRTFSINISPRNLPVSLLASYDFETANVEGKTVKDMSGKGNDLKLMGSAKVNGVLDLTANTAAGFSTNGYGLMPAGVMDGLRSYTVLLTVNASSLTKAPRLYDLGRDSGNSLFLRANALSAGIKLNGGTTTMVNAASQLSTGKEYKLAVSFDARTKTTTIYLDGEESVSGASNQNEAYMIAQGGSCGRNYIGRTQWWDGNYAADNVDFKGTIDNFQMYDICLTQKEICDLQGIPYEGPVMPAELQNPSFEESYTIYTQPKSDRAIYRPEGWQVEYVGGEENDLTVLDNKSLYHSLFSAPVTDRANDKQKAYVVRLRWSAAGALVGVYQDLQLAAGDYTLAADLYNEGPGSTFIYVNDQQAASTASSWQTKTIEFSLADESVVRIGFRGVKGSDGQVSAADNFVLTKKEAHKKGDVNIDGKVDINDVVAVINHMAGTASYKYANVNEDAEGTVDINDVVAIINIMAAQ